MRRVELAALCQQFRQHRRRRHCQRTTQRQSGQPGYTRHARQHGRNQGADEDLDASQPEHDALHAVQPRERELQSNAEHQENDAELGQMPRLLGIRHPARRMRPKPGADQKVAHDRGQSEHAEDHHDDHGSGQQQQDQRQGVGHRAVAGRGKRRTAQCGCYNLAPS
jgi:hypothetical protein